MNLQTLTPPSGEPLSLADAKAFARIGDTLDDALITSLIAAARARIEASTGMALISRELRLKLEDWPVGVVKNGALCLPQRPAQSLIGVRITDGETSEDVSDAFELQAGISPRLKLKPAEAWPWPSSVHEWIEIDWVAGFGAAEDVPDDILHALKLIIAHDYENRDATDYQAQDRLQARLDDILISWREVRI
ncbi:phage head-tail connector protein [Ponticaulis sp.]|uniref:head-tail connector protein n=1 Tax=Ponticaulis sp. TaxID=2020902 RepID=UPI000B6B7500|nr:phage head-tail connector protein [Ponticaulis sp.]MAI90405.1 hypothetical protein [Ponticaulis sp.]OUY00107.1 MAG: hypothetical protein CBB65_08195 [Hyphomonadaceae bacterium TMED5]|tara:strand:+ start:19870 stop:20445 length:576 start_codon:yes stop_codon:yes gene_type:complete